MKPAPKHLAGAIALGLATAACVPKPSPTPVEPRPVSTPASVITPAPVTGDWMDRPPTPGDWRYTGAYAGGVAQFGEPGGERRFTLRCEAASRSVVLSRAGAANGATRMTVRTESQTRTLAASAATGAAAAAHPAVESRLAASDRLLDAMALSKGRFAIEVPGTPTLYLPSWAEVSRVVEDCR